MKKKLAAIVIIFMFVLSMWVTIALATDTSIGTSVSTSTDVSTGTTTPATVGTNAGTDAGSNTNEADLKNDATVNLVQIKDQQLETLQDYQDSYGDATYGFVAYILNIIRIYSIPFGFAGIAISGIYRYIIGIRKLDVRDKGFGAMIGIITAMVICQVLPLVFAIVVKGWRG